MCWDARSALSGTHPDMHAQAPNQDALCFRDELEQWGERYHCKVTE